MVKSLQVPNVRRTIYLYWIIFIYHFLVFCEVHFGLAQVVTAIETLHLVSEEVGRAHIVTRVLPIIVKHLQPLRFADQSVQQSPQGRPRLQQSTDVFHCAEIWNTSILNFAGFHKSNGASAIGRCSNWQKDQKVYHLAEKCSVLHITHNSDHVMCISWC